MDGLTTSLEGCFAADHGLLDGLLDWVIEGIGRRMAADKVARLFAACESYLLTHMEIEERNLLSELARVREASASTLLAEHRHLRNRLAEVRVKAESGLLSIADLRRLAEELEAHSTREERSLKSWSADGLSLSQLSKVLRYMNEVATQRLMRNASESFSRI